MRPETGHHARRRRAHLDDEIADPRFPALPGSPEMIIAA
jgi:hypothetical protein